MKKVKTMVVVAAVAAGIAAVINKKKEDNNPEKEVNEHEEKEEDSRRYIISENASQFVPKETNKEQKRTDYLDEEALKEIQRLLDEKEEKDTKEEIKPIVEEPLHFYNDLIEEEPIAEVEKTPLIEEDDSTVSLRQLYAATAGVINEEEIVAPFIPQTEEIITKEEIEDVPVEATSVFDSEEEDIVSPFIKEMDEYIAKALLDDLPSEADEEILFNTEELFKSLRFGTTTDETSIPFEPEEETTSTTEELYGSMHFGTIEDETPASIEIEEEEITSPFLTEIDERFAKEILSGLQVETATDETPVPAEPEEETVSIMEELYGSMRFGTTTDETPVSIEIEEEDITSPFLTEVDEQLAKEILSGLQFEAPADETPVPSEPEEETVSIMEELYGSMRFGTIVDETPASIEIEEEEITSPFLAEIDEQFAKEILSGLQFETPTDETPVIDEPEVESTFDTEELFSSLQFSTATDETPVTVEEEEELPFDVGKLLSGLQFETMTDETPVIDEPVIEEITSPFLTEVDEQLAKEILSGLQFETRREEPISFETDNETTTSPFLTIVDEPVEEDVLSGLHFGTTIDETSVSFAPEVETISSSVTEAEDDIAEEIQVEATEEEEEIISPLITELDDHIAQEILSEIHFDEPNPFEEEVGDTLEKELVEIQEPKVVEDLVADHSEEIVEEVVEDEPKVIFVVENDDVEIEASTVSEEEETEFELEVAEEEDEEEMVFVDDDFLSTYKFNDLSPEDLDKYQIHKTPKQEEVTVEPAVENVTEEIQEEEPVSVSTVEEPIEDEVTEESTLFQLYPDMTEDEDEDEDEDDEEALRKKEAILKMKEALQDGKAIVEEEALSEESVIEEPVQEEPAKSVLFQLYPDMAEEEETPEVSVQTDLVAEVKEEAVLAPKETIEEPVMTESVVLSRSYEDMVREEDGIDFNVPPKTTVEEVLATVEPKEEPVVVAETKQVEEVTTEEPVVVVETKQAEEVTTEEVSSEAVELKTEEPSSETELSEPSLKSFEEIEENYEVDEEFLKQLMSRFDDIDDDEEELDLESFDFTRFEEEPISVEGNNIQDENIITVENEVTLVEDYDTDVLNELLSETTTQSITPAEDLEIYTALDEEEEVNPDYLEFEGTDLEDFNSYESELEKLSEAVAKLADIELDQKKNDEMIFTWDDSYQVSPDFVSEMDMMLNKIEAFSARVEGFQYELEGDGFLEVQRTKTLPTEYEYYNLNWEEKLVDDYQPIELDWELDEYMEKRLFSQKTKEDEMLTEGLKYLNQRRLKKETENRVIVSRSEIHQHHEEEYEVDPFWSYDDILMDQYLRQPFIPPHSQMNPWGYNYSQPPFTYMNPMPAMNPYQLNFTPGYGQMNFNANPYMMNPMMNQNPMMTFNPMMNPNMNMYPETTFTPPVEKIVIDEIEDLEEEIESIQVKKKIVGAEIQKVEKKPEPKVEKKPELKIDERRLEELIEQKAFELLMQQQLQQQYQDQFVNVPMQNELIANIQAPIIQVQPTPIIQEQVEPVVQEQQITTSPSLNGYQVVEPEPEPFERDERFPFIDEGVFRKLHAEVNECLNSYSDCPTLNLQHQIFYFDPEMQVKLIKQAKQSGYYCYIREDGILLEKVLSNDFDFIFETVLAMANRVLSEFSLYKGVSIFPNEQLN